MAEREKQRGRESGPVHRPSALGAPPQHHDHAGDADVRNLPSAREGETTLAALVAELRVLLDGGRARADYGDAAREARDLVAALHDQPRFWASLYPELPVDAALRARAHDAARRRAAGAPFAYAVGRASFRHLTLDVDERVLIPRPETEQLVELALGLLGDEPGGIAVDVGTGSGAIALSLAGEGHFDRVIATDLSRDALDVARTNAAHHAETLRAPVELRQGSLLDPVAEGSLRLVASNPPYITFEEARALPASVRDWEPAVALYSPGDGLALTARLVRQAAAKLALGGVLVLEVDARRAALAAELASADARLGEVSVTLDLFGRERFVAARRVR